LASNTVTDEGADMSDAATVIQNAVEAFNKSKGDALGGLFAQNFQKGAIASIKGARSDVPDLQYKIEHIKADGDTVSFAYTVTGTFKGKAVHWPGSGVATVVDGKIARLQHAEDLISKGIQIGVILSASMTGNWAGAAQGISVTLALTQTGNNITGTAKAFGASFPVTGTADYPSVSLHGNMNGVQVNFNGDFKPAPNAVAGTLTAMGSSIPVTLNRQ